MHLKNDSISHRRLQRGKVRVQQKPVLSEIYHWLLATWLLPVPSPSTLKYISENSFHVKTAMQSMQCQTSGLYVTSSASPSSASLLLASHLKGES